MYYPLNLLCKQPLLVYLNYFKYLAYLNDNNNYIIFITIFYSGMKQQLQANNIG